MTSQTPLHFLNGFVPPPDLPIAGEVICGADGEIRTHDLPLTRRLLCQLSYVGKLVGEITPK
jgi:hypothetical protein